MESISLPALYLVEGPRFTDRTWVYITLFFVWERLQSVLFIHSLRLLHLVNISLAAKESGKAVWLPPAFVSLACSSAPDRDLAPQVKERGELVKSWLNHFGLHFWIP